MIERSIPHDGYMLIHKTARFLLHNGIELQSAQFGHLTISRACSPIYLITEPTQTLQYIESRINPSTPSCGHGPFPRQLHPTEMPCRFKRPTWTPGVLGSTPLGASLAARPMLSDCMPGLLPGTGERQLVDKMSTTYSAGQSASTGCPYTMIVAGFGVQGVAGI